MCVCMCVCVCVCVYLCVCGGGLFDTLFLSRSLLERESERASERERLTPAPPFLPFWRRRRKTVDYCRCHGYMPLTLLPTPPPKQHTCTSLTPFLEEEEDC